MSKDKRAQVRVPCELRCAVEIVTWNDDNLTRMQRPLPVWSLDIGASGIGLNFGSYLSKVDLKYLLDGTKKLKIALPLPDAPEPILVFARVVWDFSHGDAQLNAERCGCEFLAPADFKLWYIKQFIKSQLADTPQNT